MKIQKSTSSEIFDEYVSKMLEKTSGVLGKGMGIPPIKPSVVPDAPVTLMPKPKAKPKPKVPVPSASVPRSVAPKSAKEIDKGLNEVEALIKSVGKMSPELSDLLRMAKELNVLSNDMIIKLVNIIKLVGKTPDEIAAQINTLKAAKKSLEHGRLSMSGKMRSQKQKIADLGAEAATLQNKLNDSVELAGKATVTADTQIAKLTNVISELAETVTRQSDEIAQLRKSNDLLEAANESLKAKGIALKPTQKSLFSRFIEKTGLAGFSKATHDKLSSSNKAGTPAAKASKDLAEDSQKQADKAAEKLINEVPQAEPTIRAAGKVAKEKGAAKSTEVIGETAEEIARPGILSRMSSGISDMMGPGLKPRSSSSITGAALTGGVMLLGKALKYAIIFGAVGVAGYLLWRTFLKDSPGTARKEINILESRLKDSIIKLEALRFKRLSDGDDETDTLIATLNGALAVLSDSVNSEADDAAYKNAFETLENTQAMVNSYLDKREFIRKDLDVDTGWLEAIASLESLNDQLGSVKVMVAQVMDRGSQTSGGEITGPIGSPEAEPGRGRRRSAVPVMVNILGEEVDIGHTSPGFRSAVPRMIEKLLGSPEGMAFIDPENKWGGYLKKSGNNKNDYLRSLYYLYKNQIFTRRQLRRFIRKNMHKAGKRRMSGWKNAVKYYRNRTLRATKTSFSENLHKNLQKPANFGESSVQSNDRQGFDMKKKADQISKEYFQDAVKGLSDQYAKSYYTGLKSMYDQKLGKTEADYNSLYELHSETGAQLIGEAHPLSVEIAESMGRGGIVENVVEQHRHNEGVALSMPSGNFRGKHAWLVKNLVKLADATDENGMSKVSDLIDTALNEIVSL